MTPSCKQIRTQRENGADMKGASFSHMPQFRILLVLPVGQILGDQKGIARLQHFYQNCYEAEICLYHIQIPRVELKEMGPLLDVVIRRSRPANPELEKEALKVAVVAKKKVKRQGACTCQLA